MTPRALSIAACAVWVGVAGIPRPAAAGQQAPAPIAVPVSLVTPPEITVQDTPVGPMFADLKGFTLYVTGRDTEPGKSSCYGPCAEQWVPLRAQADTKPFDEWSLVPRDDGRPQWAFRGRPLYRYRFEGKPRWAEAQNEFWQYATLNPFPVPGANRRGFAAAAANVKIVLPPSPGGVTGQPNRRLGTMFADSKGMTLYSRSTAAACSGACLDSWVPLPAPQTAAPIGDWTIVARTDGIAQWAYQGRPVYRSVKDLKATDANGADDEWHAILVPTTPAPVTQASPPTRSRPTAGSKPRGR
ncbi:MAG TPA: hypothetical protein VGY48_23920 [Vicinamibacterales bacterium]|jgi:predicted lipoprotein with Yx(FWY)xxD motif|nr:hypothetical protein [Vicinamibacterales bacterium]